MKHQGEQEPDPLGDLDEDRIAGVMDSMMGELGDLEETEDPRQLARLFRRFGEASGLELGPRMEEMMSRLEAGEFFRLRKRGWKTHRRPRVDDTLYFL